MGVWIKLNMTWKFCTSNWNMKWMPIFIRLTLNMFKVYYFENIRLPYHKIVFNSVRIKIKPMLWSWRLSLKVILWFWFLWTLFFPFFCVFSCFTILRLVVIFFQSSIRVIYILLLSIGFILIFLVLIFDQRFLLKLCSLNITVGTHNLLIQSSFERICFSNMFFFIYILQNIWIMLAFF